MKKTNILLTAALSITSISSVHAEWTNVYCGQPATGSWHVLEDDSGNQVTISGQKGSAQMSNGMNFDFFSVQESDYQEISSQCNNGYIPLPRGNTNSLYIFWVEKPDGNSYLNIFNQANS